MTKVRLSISLDADHAELIRTAAARAGQDVSTYVSRAALSAADHDERVAGIFADIDAHIDAVEHAPVDELALPAAEALNAAERAAIAARWDAFFRTSSHGAA